MVFANLTQRDKDAFFALLDEYFASRPHLVNGGELASTVKAAKAVNGAAAGGAIANAFAASARTRPAPPPRSPRPAEPVLTQEEEPEEEEEEEEEKPISVASRIAAAQAGLRANPPPAPRRTSTTSTTTRENVSSSGSTGSSISGLVSGRSIGNVDTASKGSAVSSLFKKPQPKPGTGVLVPSAFPKEKGGFAPPPQRVNSAASGGVGRKSPQPPRATPPVPVEDPEEEQEHSGEWAEALYDFSSNDSTDLSITTGDRLLITERSSKDWWTAESDSGRGLVPAAYVKIL